MRRRGGSERVHWTSGTVSTLWGPIRRLAEESPDRPLRVLDVACGGGDLIVSLAREARKAGVTLESSGCDISHSALDYARARAAAQQVAVQFFSADVISQPLPRDYDVIYSSLFLHHLSEQDAVKLLKSVSKSSQRLVLISDLLRSRLGYGLAWGGLRVLTRSRICHVDGPLSVRAAFTLGEVQGLADRAGLANVQLTRHWPERFLLTWTHP